MSDSALQRVRRIALNADLRLPRAAAYRLARNLEAWVDSDKRSPESVSRQLGIPTSALALARETLREASVIAHSELEVAAELDVRIVTLGESTFPEPLTRLPLPPPVLYIRGELLAEPAIAIVGSRRADAYGREAAHWFARELAARGVTIVSGYARGIDEAAHRGALEAEGFTVAVLGCGVDVDYPRGRGRLTGRVVEHGALVSEYPLGTPPLGRNFPIRNRIIAALSLGTLVVQATARSGSLITARYAMEFGRDLYALPGRIFHDRAIGPNALIRDGALIALHPDDIIDSLPLECRERLKPVAEEPDDGTESLPTGPGSELLPYLRPGDPVPADRIAEASGLPVENVLALLLELELSGRVLRHPGPAFTRSL